jgi:hypothetical protein
MQKQGQIDIEDAVRKGQTAWSNRSNVKCEPSGRSDPLTLLQRSEAL